MNNRIALAGEMYSGKSTIAQALKEKGFLVVEFSDLLKEKAVQALSTVDPVAYGDLTVVEMKRNKAAYRGFLQELGSIIWFDSDPGYVVESLEPWIKGGCAQDVVFDNVRTPSQWRKLKEYGFELVYLNVSRDVRLRRATRLGVDLALFSKMEEAPIEQGIQGLKQYAHVLDGTYPTDELVNSLLVRAEEAVA